LAFDVNNWNAPVGSKPVRTKQATPLSTNEVIKARFLPHL